MHYLSVTTTPSPMSKSGPDVLLIFQCSGVPHSSTRGYSCIKPCFSTTMHNKKLTQAEIRAIVSKGAKIRNRYNQVPHLAQDTNGKVTNSQLDTTNESQEVSPFPAGDHKAHINTYIDTFKGIANTRQKKSIKDPQRSTALERSVKYFTGGFKPV